MEVNTNVFFSLLQIREWLDSDAAQFTETPILVTNEGQSRLELFKDGELIDTVHVHRYHREELNDLLEEMGQKRDKSLTWAKLQEEKKFDFLLNNWDSYNKMIHTDEENAEADAAKAV